MHGYYERRRRIPGRRLCRCGVHQDGLVHISAMANAYVKDPRKIAKPGDIVRVKVLEVDPKRRRISMTMRLDDTPGDRATAARPAIAASRSEKHLGPAKTRAAEGDFGACCGRPRFQRLIEPHCQRNPTAFRVNLQHFDTDDIARLRDFARVLDVSIGHRGDVHQPVLVDPYINEGAERGDVRHDTFENHAGLQILELFHSLTKAIGLPR